MSERSLSRRNFLGASAGGVAIAAAAHAAGKTTAKAAGGKGGGLFPKDFAWGVATASYQVEGAAYDDGKGPSVWDVFCKKKGAVFEGDTGDVACDHYHRYKEDVALMKALGVKSYRFSVSWPRVLPDGIGASNPKGLDFYSRLLDELLKAGIEPMCTVFHWDYPQALYKKGGWLQRESADWFAEYTSLLADRFSDRVKLWATQNEPQCFIGMALLDGVHAPGDKLHFSQYLTAAHNGMRAHAKAVQVLRARARDPKATKIGYVTATQVTQPATDRPEDVEAARTSMFTVGYRGEWNNTWWLDPVVLGRYPDDGIALAGKDMPKFKPADLDEMKQPLDWLGLNIYKAAIVRRGADGKPETLPVPSGYPRAGSDWETITPGATYWGPRFMYDRYKLPLSITENGLATRDQLFLDGKVHDPQRIDYMHRYLAELGRAIKDGVPVTSYYAWSLLDNFEWADGYKQRFGLVYVDYQNQKRVPKDSFDWYKKVIATNGKGLGDKTAVPVTQVTPV
ncbi:MAG TPA: GH1 family beta-glucosidase [Polyangia bacterium]|nr:GH1 family beta-glucosidase [Polyangia bacterium]